MRARRGSRAVGSKTHLGLRDLRGQAGAGVARARRSRDDGPALRAARRGRKGRRRSPGSARRRGGAGACRGEGPRGRSAATRWSAPSVLLAETWRPLPALLVEVDGRTCRCPSAHTVVRGRWILRFASAHHQGVTLRLGGSRRLRLGGGVMSRVRRMLPALLLVLAAAVLPAPVWASPLMTGTSAGAMSYPHIAPGPATVLPDLVGSAVAAQPLPSARVPQDPFLGRNPYGYIHDDSWNSDTSSGRRRNRHDDQSADRFSQPDDGPSVAALSREGGRRRRTPEPVTTKACAGIARSGPSLRRCEPGGPAVLAGVPTGRRRRPRPPARGTPAARRGGTMRRGTSPRLREERASRPS